MSCRARSSTSCSSARASEYHVRVGTQLFSSADQHPDVEFRRGSKSSSNCRRERCVVVSDEYGTTDRRLQMSLATRTMVEDDPWETEDLCYATALAGMAGRPRCTQR